MAVMKRYAGTQRFPGVRRPQVIADTAVGVATQQLGRQVRGVGGDVAQLGQQLQSDQDRIDEFERTRARTQFSARTTESESAQLQKLAPGAAGYSTKMLAEYDKHAKAYVNSVPQSARKRAQADVDAMRVTAKARYDATEKAERQRYFQAGIAETTDQIAKDIRANPAIHDQAVARGRKTIAESGLDDAQKETATKALDRMASISWLQALPAQERAKLLEGGEDYFSALRRAESAGDDAVKNPNSSALGRYQFTEATWQDLMKKHPELGLTEDGRLDPEQQEKAIRVFTAGNAAYLREKGLRTTSGNLYAAHFLGAGGAVQVLSAADDAKMRDIVSPAVIKANLFLRNMTVADFRAWASRKAGGPDVLYVPDQFKERLGKLSYADTVSLADQAQADLMGAAAERMKAFDLQITAGPLDVDAQVILGDPVLDDSQKAALIRSHDAALLARQKQRDTLAWAAANQRANPFDQADREKAASIFKYALEEGKDADEVALSLTAAKGLVPRPYVNMIRHGMDSHNAEEVALAYQRSEKLFDTDPQAVAGHEFGHVLEEAALKWRFFREEMDLNVQQAAQRLAALNRPEARERRNQLWESPEYKKSVEAIDYSTIEGMFEKDLLWRSPQLGVNNAARTWAVAEFKKIYSHSYGETGGNAELAMQLAFERFSKIWGTSDYYRHGDRTVIQYGAEKIHRPIGGNHDYIRVHALEFLKSKGIDATEIFLASDARYTLKDIRAGARDQALGPRMLLEYKTKDDDAVKTWAGEYRVDVAGALADFDAKQDEQLKAKIAQNKAENAEKAKRQQRRRDRGREAARTGDIKPVGELFEDAADAVMDTVGDGWGAAAGAVDNFFPDPGPRERTGRRNRVKRNDKSKKQPR